MAEPSASACRLVNTLLSLSKSGHGIEIRRAMALCVDEAFEALSQRVQLVEHDRACFLDAMIQVQARLAAAEAEIRRLHAGPEAAHDA